MIKYLTFPERPEAITYVPLPDGRADIWLRKNIREFSAVEDEEGETVTVTKWAADEAYMRGELSREYVDANFDRLYAEAAGWEPEQAYTPTVEERIETLENCGLFGRIGDGLYYPADLKPDNIERGSLLLGDAACEKLGKLSLAVSVGYGVNLAAEAPKGSTEYRLVNNLANRILAQIIDGAAVCTNANTTTETVRVESVTLANGGAVVPSVSGGGQIVITTRESANKYEPTKTLRVYPDKASFASVFVGAAGSHTGTSGYSIVGGQGVRCDANASLVVGMTIYNTGNTSLIGGRLHANSKQNAFLAGEGHDTTNAGNNVAAVGKYAKLAADTAFAVGMGTDGTKRKNAFEVKTDGAAFITLKAPNGKLFRLTVNNNGELTTEEV